MKKLQLFLLFLFFCTNALSLTPEDHLKDPKQEQRAAEIFKETKCLVCQGQSIYGSNTEFSRNLRKVIRDKISEGLTNQEIKNHLENEFGKQILFSPGEESKSMSQYLLEILPFLLTSLLLYLFYRKNVRGFKE